MNESLMVSQLVTSTGAALRPLLILFVTHLNGLEAPIISHPQEPAMARHWEKC